VADDHHQRGTLVAAAVCLQAYLREVEARERQPEREEVLRLSERRGQPVRSGGNRRSKAGLGDVREVAHDRSTLDVRVRELADVERVGVLSEEVLTGPRHVARQPEGADQVTPGPG